MREDRPRTHWQKASAGGGGDPDTEKESEEVMGKINVLVDLTGEEYDKLADLTELYAHETDQDTIKWMIRTLHETMFGTEEKDG